MDTNQSRSTSSTLERLDKRILRKNNLKWFINLAVPLLLLSLYIGPCFTVHRLNRGQYFRLNRPYRGFKILMMLLQVVELQ